MQFAVSCRFVVFFVVGRECEFDFGRDSGLCCKCDVDDTAISAQKSSSHAVASSPPTTMFGRNFSISSVLLSGEGRRAETAAKEADETSRYGEQSAKESS